MGGWSSTPAEPPDTEATDLPLLPAGVTVGTTLYGGAELPSPGTPERALLEEGVAGGLGGFTYYVDWVDLEPEPGVYTFETLTATLEGLEALGVVPFVNLTVGDIEDWNLPPDLSDGDGGLAPGVRLDDPEVLARFGALVERVAPRVVERGGGLLGVGNEVDARLDGHPPEELDSYVRFVEAARERVAAVEPELAVAVTLTKAAVQGRSRTWRELRRVTDVVAVNHAPILPDFFVLPEEEIVADLRETLDAYGSGPVVIQELTCPSAVSMGASEAWQAACFRLLLTELRSDPRVRFASIFTFQDFAEPTCTAVQEALMGDELSELPHDVAERLGDYFCELGLVAPDGTPKPAWDAVLDQAHGG